MPLVTRIFISFIIHLCCCYNAYFSLYIWYELFLAPSTKRYSCAICICVTKILIQDSIRWFCRFEFTSIQKTQQEVIGVFFYCIDLFKYILYSCCTLTLKFFLWLKHIFALFRTMYLMNRVSGSMIQLSCLSKEISATAVFIKIRILNPIQFIFLIYNSDVDSYWNPHCSFPCIAVKHYKTGA